MYLGRVVEAGSMKAVRRSPQHPYTRALFSSVLPAHPDRRPERIKLIGPLPSPINPPSGCVPSHTMPACASHLCGKRCRHWSIPASAELLVIS